MSTHQNEEGSSPSKRTYSSDTESPFPGFNKMPRVSVERIDVSPYLVDINISPQVTSGVPPKGILKTPSIDKFSLKCSINLFRDDLQKIQHVFKDRAEDSLTPKNYSPVGFQCNINEKLNPNNYVPDISKPKKTVSFDKTVKVIEVREYYKCKKCPRIYYTRKALKKHCKKMHKKQHLYVCNFCEKHFMDRMFFKSHMKLHCDVCGFLSPSRSKCLEHRRTVCRTLHKCPSCDSTFFRQKDLRDHTYDHIDTCFICDTCKDKFDTKCAVAHHIRFLHSKRRPKAMFEMKKVGVERLFLCNFCDESNVDRDLIEEHQISLPDLSNRIMKGTRDYYFCDQCKKKFNTEKKMLDHKWTHFLNSDTKDESSNSPESEKMNNNDSNDDKQTEMFVTHNIMLSNAQDDSRDSSISVSTIQSNDGSIGSSELGRKDIHNLSLLDLLSSKSSPPPFSFKLETKIVTNIQKIYKLDEVPPIMLKPKVLLERFKINDKDVMDKSSTYKWSEGKVIEASAMNESKLEADKSTMIGRRSPQLMQVDRTNLLKKYLENEIASNQKVSTENQVKRVDIGTSTNTVTGLHEDFKDPSEKRPRKTLMSKHQCTICGQYYSSAYCLKRHMTSMHHDMETLQCKVCEETFVWPSLLFSHKCIRLHRPEMPFQDARPEIHFDNIQSLNPEEFDGMNIAEIENDRYGIDFEIPEPIQQHNSNQLNGNGKSVLQQVLSQPIQKNQTDGFVLIPNHLGEFAYIQPQFTQPNAFAQMPKHFSQINGLNRPAYDAPTHSVTNATQNIQFVPNGTEQNEFVPNGTMESRFVPNEMTNNLEIAQNSPTVSHNSNFNSNLPIAQLERLGYKLIMQEVPIEF